MQERGSEAKPQAPQAPPTPPLGRTPLHYIHLCALLLAHSFRCWLLAAGDWLLAARCWPLTTHWRAAEEKVRWW